MPKNKPHRFTLLRVACAVLYCGTGIAAVASSTDDEVKVLRVGELAPIAEVDSRFISYNVESVEVTGGNFWAPYRKPGEAVQEYDSGPHAAGFSTDQYRKREPLDLVGNDRLRMLTKALGPAYMRVSGTWANSIYFQGEGEPAEPPAGYQGVLTQEQWAGVIDFAEAVDAKILTSFAVSDGAQNAEGVWSPNAARRQFEFTHSLGGKIDAVELMNEPNVRPKVYAAEDYARDHAALQKLVAEISPQTLVVGPGSTGEAGFKLFANPPAQMSTARLLGGSPKPEFDAFSYHFYGAVSQRCKSLGLRDPNNPRQVTTSIDDALTEGWLARADQAQTLYKSLRDRFAPGAPIWITESAQAACGGDPWSSTFLDSFRYIDQLGRLAQQGVEVVFHNTLAASDYALIDDETWLPRPNYWAALLWRRLMGNIVLDAGPNDSSLHTYAHCMREQPGGVTVAVVNTDTANSGELKLPQAATSYVLTAKQLLSDSVELNGRNLALTPTGDLPSLQGKQVAAGEQPVPAASIAFLAIPDAGNPACQ